MENLKILELLKLVKFSESVVDSEEPVVIDNEEDMSEVEEEEEVIGCHEEERSDEEEMSDVEEDRNDDEGDEVILLCFKGMSRPLAKILIKIGNFPLYGQI